MCITQCLLALAALYVGLAHSWDIAVGVGDQLVFYTNRIKTNTVNLISRNLTALAYYEVNNLMLYVDKQSNNDAICGFNLNSEENTCFIERNGRNIHSIAFDPATQTLFFTDTNDNSINWISLKPGYLNNVYGNLLIKMDDRTPSDIAVDSCTGYIYWINSNYKNNKASIERARFNGSERKNFNKKYEKYEVLSLVADPQTRKIYYFDGFSLGYSYEHEYLNRGDLDGKNELITYYYEDGHYSAAKQLTVSKDYLYWVNSSEGYNYIWQLPKNAIKSKGPEKISAFYSEKQPAIATNYKIEDQIPGLQNCEALSSLIQTITVTNHSLNIDQTTETEATTEYRTDVELFCVHGVHVSETSVCNCTPGYTGERCEVSVCHNYCLHGNCSSNDEGLPTCSCEAGYTGDRCEDSVCFGYCSNNGTCSVNENSEPVCECKGDYTGDRCEVSDCLNYCVQGNCSVPGDGLPICSCNAGYTGERCEVSVCFGYCSNNGTCSVYENSEPVYECKGDYTGDRCEVSHCLNYCIQGNCSFNEKGLPTCRCISGYSGDRCEVYACHGYCLNEGNCSLNEEDDPVCQCAGNYEGLRCEAVKNVTVTINNTPTYNSIGRNLTLADFLANWRKPSAKVTVTVEVLS